MKRIVKILQNTAAIFALIFISQISAQAQKDLVKLSAPTEQIAAGFDKTFCVNLEVNRRICKGLFSAETSTGNARFFIEHEGSRVASWSAAAFLGDVSRFEIWRGDLDNDEQNEIIIANFDAQSNGMGVNYWTIYVLHSSWKNPNGKIEPLRFSAEDFSVRGGFIKNFKTKQFDVLISNWERNWQTAKQEEGLYLVGRWFNYRDGMLIPSAKNVVVRRYTKKFEMQRLKILENEAGDYPYVWIKSADVEKRRADLMNLPKEKIITAGVVENAETETLVWSVNDETDSKKETPSFALFVKTDGGKIQSFSYDEENANDGETSIAFFGDGQTKRRYPDNYLPANSSEKLPGKKISVVHYADANGGGFNVLWFNDKE